MKLLLATADSGELSKLKTAALINKKWETVSTPSLSYEKRKMLLTVHPCFNF